MESSSHRKTQPAERDSPFDMVPELLRGSTNARKESVDNPLLHACIIVDVTGTESLLNDPPVFFPTRSGIHLRDDGLPSHPIPKISRVALAYGG